MFVRLCYWSEAVDDVLLEAVFVRLCYWSEAVDDALEEAQFLGLRSGCQSLMMLLWRHCF